MALQFEVYDRANNSLGDISSLCLNKSVTVRLNRPATARAVVPSELDSFLRSGDRCLKVRLDGSIIFNGIVWFVEDSGDENTIYSEFVAVDPMIWWKYRIARDPDGDFSLPTFMTDLQFGPLIIQDIVRNSALALNDNGLPDGPLGLDYLSGVFETGGSDLSGAPIDYPAAVGDIATLLTDTGRLDIVLTYVDDNDGYPGDVMAVLNGYNGLYGTTNTGTTFDYQTGENNVRAFRRTEDMATIGNALRTFFTPKQSIQRYRANITRDDRGEEDLDLPPDPQSPAADGDLQNLIQDSRDRYGTFVDHMYYDVSTDFPIRQIKPAYWELWKTASRLRAGPRTLLSITPVRGVAPTFGLGDIITVNCGEKVRGGFEGLNQRVYEYTVSEEKDGPIEISELVTSADAESGA